MEHENDNRNIFQKAKDKVIDTCQKAKAKIDSATDAVLHDEETQIKIIRAAVMTGAVVKAGLSIKKAITPSAAEFERRRKSKTYYDPHSHLRFNTKRELTNEEAWRVRERTDQGENAVDVLREMNLMAKNW